MSIIDDADDWNKCCNETCSKKDLIFLEECREVYKLTKKE